MPSSLNSSPTKESEQKLFDAGIFIVLEGIEGSGKSLQLKQLSVYLSEKGTSPLITWEPGGTSAGRKIRNLLLFGPSLAPETELLLYLSDRAQHVKEVITPALQEGKIVICDRYYPSTLAYQGYGRGLKVQEIIRMNLWATGGLEPHLIILIDLPIELALERIQGRNLDRLEKEEIAFHRRVRNGYITLAKENPERYIIVDGRRRPEEVFQVILSGLRERVPQLSSFL